LSVPEVRRLLQILNDPPARRAERLQWLQWRQAHQANARRWHLARRAGQRPCVIRAPVVVLVPGTPGLTDESWRQVAVLLPPDRRRGRPYGDHKRIVAGMLWVLHTGAAWREMPSQFGPWQTVYSRYARWRRDGTWGRIRAVLLQAGTPSPT
jgi:hypothetical protein